MSKNTNPLKKILAPARRFTYQNFINIFNNNASTLPAQLHKFPNYGLGFKVFHQNNKNNYWIIDQVDPISSRHANFYGLRYSNGEPSNKIEKLNNTYKKSLWNYEVPDNIKCVTQNGVEFDISKISRLRSEKIEMRDRRFKILGEEKPERLRLLEDKEKRRDSKTKKKK